MANNTTTNTTIGIIFSVFMDRGSQNERFLQPLWDLLLGFEEWLVSPVFPVFMSVGFFFSFCLPFMLADLYCCQQKWYLRYKIQPDKEVTMPQIWDTLSLTFWNQMMFLMPATMAQWVWMPPTQLPTLAPTVWEVVWHIVVSLIVFDFQYFVWHWTHHKVRFLYKAIHVIHHRYTATFVWVTQYLHPWELVTVGFLNSTNTWFLDCHPLTLWIYLLVTVTISVEAHIGFDFPYLPHQWFPFGLVGGSPKHDMHHQKPLTNYQPFFNHWDKIFGTFCPPMSGSGVKSKALMDWERKHKEAKKQG